MQGLVPSMTDSAQLLTLAQPGHGGLQAEGGDVLVTGAVWLTEKLCEIICKSDLLFWQNGSCWNAVSDMRWVSGGDGVFVHKSRYGSASPSLATMCSSNSKDGHASHVTEIH